MEEGESGGESGGKMDREGQRGGGLRECERAREKGKVQNSFEQHSAFALCEWWRVGKGL